MVDDDAEDARAKRRAADSDASDDDSIDESFSEDELSLSSSSAASSDYESEASSDNDDDAPPPPPCSRPRGEAQRQLYDKLAAGEPDDALAVAAEATRDPAWHSAGVLSLATLGGEIRRFRLARECNGQCVLCGQAAEGGASVIAGLPWALLVCTACNPDRALCYAQLMSLAREAGLRWETDFARLWSQRETLLASAARTQK